MNDNLPFKQITNPNLSWASASVSVPSSSVTIQVKQENGKNSLLNPDLCFITEEEMTPELFSQMSEQYEAEKNENNDFEIASMFVLRDLNSIENIIDYSLSPKIKRPIKPSRLWDPREYLKVYQEMQNAKPDDDEDDTDDTTTQTTSQSTREPTPPPSRQEKRGRSRE